MGFCLNCWFNVRGNGTRSSVGGYAKPFKFRDDGRQNCRGFEHTVQDYLQVFADHSVHVGLLEDVMQNCA